MELRNNLFRSLKKTYQYLTHPRVLRNDLEILLDLYRTRREVGNWAAQGAAQGVENANPDRLFAIVSFTNLPMHAKFHCLAAKVMQLYGYTPMVFTNSGNRFGHEYFRMFGITNLIMWDQVLAVESPLEEQLWNIVDTLLPASLKIVDARNITYHDIQVGKHALSKTCRQRVEGRLNLEDPETLSLFQEHLFKAIQSVIVAERFFDQHPVQKMLVRDPGYTPNASIYEVALQRGVDCIVLEFGQRRSTWVFKRYTPETRGRHYFSLSPSTWEKIKRLPWTEEMNQKVEKEFSGRYRPDSVDDTRRLQTGKRIKSPDEVRTQLRLDPNKKTAVIFSHIAWDAAFFYGDCLFDDFEDWLYQTVQFVAQECPHINWIVKEHPFNVFKLQREKVKDTSERRLLKPLMPFPEHVRFLPADTDINTLSLFPVVDYVLTVNGTVGMEFPCFGIPAIVAGTGRYDGLGFTVEPKSREQYFETLRHLHEIPSLAPEIQELARKHYYALMIGRQISFEDITPMELKRLHEAQSNVHDNIRFKARSLDGFMRAYSVNLLGNWLANSYEPDLIDFQLS